jgi:hypothetical protein
MGVILNNVKDPRLHFAGPTTKPGCPIHFTPERSEGSREMGGRATQSDVQDLNLLLPLFLLFFLPFPQGICCESR